MPAKPKTIDEYLRPLRPEQRAALEKLRRAIHAAAPTAQECITYSLPGFRHDGILVAFGARTNHCAFYPMSSTTIAAHAAELASYDTSAGTVRFPANKPLPAALVRKLVKARLAENAARVAGRSRKPRGEQRSDPTVTAFMAKLDHPLKADIESVRRMLLDASPRIREGIKWNAPSFRTSEYFATVNLRSRDRVQLVFHLGAKVKDGTKDMRIADPAGLIKWLAKDRCLVTLGAGEDIRANRAAFQALVRAWIRYV